MPFRPRCFELRPTLVLGTSFLICGVSLHAQSPVNTEAKSSPLVASKTIQAETVQDVAAKVWPSVVRLKVLESSTDEGRETKSVSYGSGAIISTQGHILTNHHVAGEALSITVTLADKRELVGKLIGTDSLSDLAIVKIEGGPFPATTWGDDKALSLGEPVLALGSPYALSQSVTAGIVSQKDMVYNETEAIDVDSSSEPGAIVRWIAHDASIFPGNSGGPLVNLRGEVVGINEMEYGLSGAIPATLARKVAAQLIEKGRVSRTFTGLSIQVAPAPIGKSGQNQGVLVASVLASSPAYKAGIRAGDTLLQATNSAGTTVFHADFGAQLPPLVEAVGMWPIGEKTTISLKRGAQNLDVELTPTARTDTSEISREVVGFDLTACNIDSLSALQSRLPGTRGAYITSLAEGGAGATAEPPIVEGDIIKSLNRAPISDVAQLQDSVRKLPRSDEGTAALVELWRDGETIFSVARLNRAGLSDASIELPKAWLPIQIQAVSPALQSLLKLPAGTQGVRITRVLNEKSALRVGDVLTHIDGVPLEVRSAEDIEVFWAMLREYNVGSSAQLRLIRGAKPLLLKIKLETAPRQEREMPVLRDANFGFSARDISYWDRKKGSVGETVAGVYLTEVGDGSALEVAGIGAGEFIMAIDGVPVGNLKALQKTLANLEERRASSAVFFVNSGNSTQFYLVKTPWSE